MPKNASIAFGASGINGLSSGKQAEAEAGKPGFDPVAGARRREATQGDATRRGAARRGTAEYGAARRGKPRHGTAAAAAESARLPDALQVRAGQSQARLVRPDSSCKHDRTHPAV